MKKRLVLNHIDTLMEIDGKINILTEKKYELDYS